MWQKFLSRVAAEAGTVIAKVAQEELAEYAEQLRTPVVEPEEANVTDEDEPQNEEEEDSQKTE